MNILNKIILFFKSEKVDVRLEIVKEDVYKNKNNIIDSSVLKSSDDELKETKKQKTEIKSVTL